LYNGNLWANLYAFSSTNARNDGTGGYPTFPVKMSDEIVKDYAPPSTSKKSSWEARIPIHCILYRWYNNGKKIPSSMDVSHLAGNKWVVTPAQLITEDPVLNRSRDACHKYKWHENKKEDCNNCVRCPHIPVCCNQVEKMPNEELVSMFISKKLQPLGKTQMVKFLKQRPSSSSESSEEESSASSSASSSSSSSSSSSEPSDSSSDDEKKEKEYERRKKKAG